MSEKNTTIFSDPVETTLVMRMLEEIELSYGYLKECLR